MGPERGLLGRGPGLIHGELGRVFLRQRFHDDAYAVLRADDLDEDRLRLYRLAMHLSLVAGPLRLLDGDYPEPLPMRAIAEHSIGQTLTLLASRVPCSESGPAVWHAQASGGPMHYSYVKAVGALAPAGPARTGVAGITTGWVPPFGRSTVLRPKLWGYGALVSAVGMAVYMFLGPFRGPDMSMAPYAFGGMGVGFVGMALRTAARRPGDHSVSR